MGNPEYYKILSEFSLGIIKKDSISEVLWYVAKNVIKKLKFEDCVIYLINGKSQNLEQVAAFGPKNPELEVIVNPISIPIGKGIVGSVALTGKSEIINDTTLDSRYIMDDLKRNSEMAVPFRIGQETAGVLDFESSTKAFFTEAHRILIESIGSILSIKLSQLESRYALENSNNKLKVKVLERTKELTESNKN